MLFFYIWGIVIQVELVNFFQHLILEILFCIKYEFTLGFQGAHLLDKIHISL